jgi:DNA-binding response OmpR family regulator
VNVNAAPPVVLVADDEPTMLELVARHLRSMDRPKIEVIEASDGDEAWRLARERLPDLVVLDVMMPGMSGWEVCRKIRQDAALAHTGVLMLTGIGESLNEATSPLFGADEYIDKPFDFEQLDEKILAVLRRRASQREAVPRPRAESAHEATGNGVGGPAKAARSVRPAKNRGRAAKAKKASGRATGPAKKASRVRGRSPAATKTRSKQEKPQKTEKGKKTMAAKKGAKKAAKKTAKKTAKKGKKK